MADSLRDQLLKTGLVQKLKAEARDARPPERPQGQQGRGKDSRPPNPGPRTQKPQAQRPQVQKPPRPPRSQEEIDLARAYALRDRAEREQRESEKKQAEQRAKEKAERKQKLNALLAGKSLNRQEADVARHFPHGDKIRRVYCTPEQLIQVNAGELAVVQHLGRYLLVTSEVGEQVRVISAEALVLLCDPNAPAEDDIPADLIW
jgi:uncharacterized protein YaiL (DUF2058 family)